MAGENISHYSRGIRSKFSDNYSNLISQKVKEVLFNNVDVIFFNFEYSLTDDGHDYSSIDQSIYSAPKESLDIFPEGNIKIVNIANNHFAQHGLGRVRKSVQTLLKHGYKVVGRSYKPTKIELGNINLYTWGVSLVSDNFYEGGINNKNDYRDVLRKLELPREKQGNDYWIISIHWGEEYIKQPNRNQQLLAQMLVNKGFDIIHGHHPHVIQSVEIIDKGLVFYSLGNFIFDQNFSQETQLGLAVKVEINDERDAKYYIVKSKKYSPCCLKEVDVDSLKLSRKKSITPIKAQLTSLKYRLLMKVELVLNIFEVSPKTIKYIIRRTNLYKSIMELLGQ